MTTDAFNNSWARETEPAFTNNNYHYHRSGRLLMVCNLCGVMVADMALHDGWHDSASIEGEFIGEGEIVSDEDAIVTDQPSITERESNG